MVEISFVFHSLGFSRNSRISKFSRISRKWTFRKRPFSKRPFFRTRSEKPSIPQNKFSLKWGDAKIFLTTRTPHINKKYAPEIWHKRISQNKGTFTENVVHEPTFMAYELRLLWHTNPDFYAIWTVFVGGGGGLQYIDDATPNDASLRSFFGSGHIGLDANGVGWTAWISTGFYLFSPVRVTPCTCENTWLKWISTGFFNRILSVKIAWPPPRPTPFSRCQSLLL